MAVLAPMPSAEREHRDGGESRPRAQHAHGVADVAPRAGHVATDSGARRRHHVGGQTRRSVELLARQRERVLVALPSGARGAPGLLDVLGEFLAGLIRQRARPGKALADQRAKIMHGATPPPAPARR